MHSPQEEVARIWRMQGLPSHAMQLPGSSFPSAIWRHICNVLQAEKENDESYYCLSDFIAPKETGIPDYLGLFANAGVQQKRPPGWCWQLAARPWAGACLFLMPVLPHRLIPRPSGPHVKLMLPAHQLASPLP